MKFSKLHLILTTAVSFLVALGYFMPNLKDIRPVFGYEVDANTARLDERDCKRAMAEYYVIMKEIHPYVKRGEVPPEWLTDKLAEINADKKKYCN